MAVVQRSGTADAERMQGRDENEVRRSEAEKGRAKREGVAPAERLPIPPSPPFALRANGGFCAAKKAAGDIRRPPAAPYISFSSISCRL